MAASWRTAIGPRATAFALCTVLAVCLLCLGPCHIAARELHDSEDYAEPGEHAEATIRRPAKVQRCELYCVNASFVSPGARPCCDESELCL
eukprot:scaffold51_cov401-Prasinococcus_capsulatus_cf.AAC.12